MKWDEYMGMEMHEATSVRIVQTEVYAGHSEPAVPAVKREMLPRVGNISHLTTGVSSALGDYFPPLRVNDGTVVGAT
jgi:hypothetical protein